MWKLLPWTGRGASGYPQRECFFCRTTSIILPPYKQQEALQEDLKPQQLPQQPNVASSSSTPTISTGTPTNWFCSSCHCQNVAEQDGTPVEQYTRPMWDEAWNRDRSQLMRHTRPQTPRPARASAVLSPNLRAHSSQPGTTGQAAFKFCHTCQTNQVLTLNMLADYLPSEDDHEYQQKLQQLPEYRASIASRYPPVCSDCAPKVEERITERDQFTRSWSLGKWLDLKKKASLSGLAEQMDGLSSTAAMGPEQTAPIPRTPTHSTWTTFKGVLGNMIKPDDGSTWAKIIFVLVNTGIWAIYLATALRTHDAASAAESIADGFKGRTISLFTPVLEAVVLILVPKLVMKSAKMDPLKRSIERARGRQVRVEVEGMKLWRTTQNVIEKLRSIVWLLTVLVTKLPNVVAGAFEWMEAMTARSRMELLQLAAVSVLISEVGLTAFAASQLRARPPAPLQLVSRPIDANGEHSGHWHPASDALLTSLSLDDKAARPSLAFGQRQNQNKSILSPHTEQGWPAPRIERDADGDAVMEDAVDYAARRASHCSDDDWEQDSARLSAPSASSWSRNRPVDGSATQSGFASTSAPMASRNQPQRSTKYNDFQLGPQRFWEPQNPTGLEDVFGRAVSLDDTPQHSDESAGRWSKWFGFS